MFDVFEESIKLTLDFTSTVPEELVKFILIFCIIDQIDHTATKEAESRQIDVTQDSRLTQYYP